MYACYCVNVRCLVEGNRFKNIKKVANQYQLRQAGIFKQALISFLVSILFCFFVLFSFIRIPHTKKRMDELRNRCLFCVRFKFLLFKFYYIYFILLQFKRQFIFQLLLIFSFFFLLCIKNYYYFTLSSNVFFFYSLYVMYSLFFFSFVYFSLVETLFFNIFV